MNSVILSTYREQQNPFLDKALAGLSRVPGLEVCLVDGSETLDETLQERAAKFGFRFIPLPDSNRAQRYNKGLELVRGDLVLFHHPRSLISDEGLKWFASFKDGRWGGFTHRFDREHFVLRFTSWYSNQVRPRRGILYLDHCIFAPRDWLLQVDGVPDWDVFEDTELSLKLRKFCLPMIAPFSSTTSAVRFDQNGVWRQAWLNQKAKWQYYMGTSHGRINRRYEKGLNLNADK